LRSKSTRLHCTIDTLLTTQEVSMPEKNKIAVQPIQAVQTSLFRPPSRSLPSWNQMPEAVKARVVEALAQVLLLASGAISEGKEAVND
jgi:hypothetical protein